jgi:Flp pilus assembly pilin Flp
MRQVQITSLLTRFKNHEDGAITVDWVVLTAGLVVLVGLIGGMIATGVESAGQSIQTELEAPSAFSREDGT